MPFEQYLELALQGNLGQRTYSHSFLKREQSGQSPYMELTDKMRLGSMVDDILTSPETVNPAVNPEMFKRACKIASEIKKQFKGMLNSFVPQVSYTGQIIYKGIAMNVCGRLDWLLEKHAVIDLKVTDAKTDKAFAGVIDFMGYRNQMFNYCGLSQTKVAYIIPYSTKAGACLSVVKMEWNTGSNEFFENAVLKFGV